jgi:hypothetical protein
MQIIQVGCDLPRISEEDCFMKCPICTIDLVMSEKKGIEIDYCPKCRGVWLDRGELDKIIEKSLEIQTHDSYEKRNVMSRQDQKAQDYYRKPRRKSFLEELFD